MSERYKSNAFDCVRLAHGSSSSESKVVLLMMARAWIKLGEMAAHAAPQPDIAEAAH
jgi:hypothetical protein